MKLALHLGLGAWKSGVQKMKVNKGLAVPIILGMPWLSSEQILIDLHEWTAVDKRMGYNILNPPPHVTRACTTTQVPPPPTPKKIRVPKPPTLEETGPPALAGYLPPGPIMAAMQDSVEGLTFQEVLKAKDAKMKHKYADRFHMQFPNTTDH